MMEIVIKIPEEAKQAFDCAESNELKGGYYDHGGVIGEAIRNGIPLPKHHGRLIDADALLDKKQDYGEGQMKLILIDPYYVRKAPTIIEGSDSE